MLKMHAIKYLQELSNSLKDLPLDKIKEIVNLLKNAYKNGNRIFIMGNGGSAATASHFVCDLSKGTYLPGKKRFKVVGLTDNVPLITAWSNDTKYNNIFKAQLENLLETDDLVVVFTGSGNSANVLNAVKYGSKVGAKTIAFTGFKGGKIKKLVDVCAIVPSDNMERIEDIHLILEHLIKLYLMEEISTGKLK